MPEPQPASTLLQIRDLKHPLLRIDAFQIQRGECWAIIGRNGAGKHHLSQLLDGKLEVPRECLQHHFKRIRILSFEAQQALYEQELHDDDSEFMEGQDSGSTVRELLGLQGSLPEHLKFLRLEPLLDRGYRLLSSGEARKTLLAQALLAEPDLLVLDEPFDSLDRDAMAHLDEFFAGLLQHGGPTLLFLLNTLDEVHSWHSHLAVMDKGELITAGPTASLRDDTALQALLTFNPGSLPDWPAALPAQPVPDILVELRQGLVRYGDREIFSGFDFRIRRGEHTLLTGPNGCGKSTLLGLITGDHPQCYSNDLHIFGTRRGSGETIWQLKRQLGIVSASLHRDHRVSGSALQIVLSGFHDTIGLYDAVTPDQVAHAKRWLQLTGMETKTNAGFRQLSYGEQRLVLVARALVKQPALLILDEPTQGLDAVNRLRVLYFLEHMATQQLTTIVMVSHRLDEQLALFRQHIHMDSQPAA
jgi:molybdate transport system ATP-binding protein